jgi:ferredoxin-type protein NapF
MTAISRSRRALLRGDPTPRDVPLRPPWSVAEETFTDACTRCGECLDACPEDILIHGDGGFPTVDFQRGECSFCQDCVDACPEPAFLDPTEHPPWRQTARISEACLCQRGVVCQNCRDACPENAIRFPPRLGGPALPVLDTSRCTGCGACVAICPSQAIGIRRDVREATA